MSKNTSVELGDEIAGFVASQVKIGRYGSASEDIARAGLRPLQNEETKLEALRAALITGDQSGKPAGFDIDQFIASRKAVQHD